PLTSDSLCVSVTSAADNLTVNEQLTGPNAAGVNSILPKEHGSQFFYLPIIRHSDDEVSAVCSWDSSIHDSVHLNRVTSPNERIYVIIKATVQLSHPASMELVVRKRISVNIYNKQVCTDWTGDTHTLTDKHLSTSTTNRSALTGLVTTDMADST
uniref:Kinesin-like domain-containing protein n=1 Tax=Hucho hucho TaxID=62062 RepID=A0A4W5LCB5_9TELE